MAARTLLSATITTAVTGITTDAVAFDRDNIPEVLVLDCVFTYGSGGTTAKFWLQTTFDDGTTWIDILNFAAALASIHKIANLNSRTPVTTPVDATDATLADNTAKDGILGDKIRVKYTTTGTYAGSTTITIRALTRG